MLGTHVAALVVVGPVRQDESEATERPRAGVHSLGVVQTAGHHGKVMGRDGN